RVRPPSAGSVLEERTSSRVSSPDHDRHGMRTADLPRERTGYASSGGRPGGSAMTQRDSIKHRIQLDIDDIFTKEDAERALAAHRALGHRIISHYLLIHLVIALALGCVYQTWLVTLTVSAAGL